MKREDLLNAIDEIENGDDIEKVKSKLTQVAIEFCDDFEHKFNTIRDELDPLTSHIDIVFNAHAVAESGSSDLY